MIRVHRLILVLFAGSFAFSLLGFSQAQQFPETMFQEMRWRMIGPFRGGRTRAVAGVPGQPNLFYIGAVNGGVWKSDDYGRTWTPIFDQEPTQSVGAIAVAASDPKIIYVASGEGLHRPDLSVGNGIYKSTDAGKTWTHLGLRDGQQIPALAVDPRDPNKLFAAVLGHPYGPNEERGIFRSTDGGNTWQKVLYKDENTGGSDVEIDPSNPDVLYASLWEAREGPWEDNNQFQGTGGGLFKSTDGGSTWRALKNGLPNNLTQVNVAIAASDPNRLYATVATTERGGYGSAAGLGFYRSDDAGENWHVATTDPRPAMRIGGGDLPIPRVDPKNPDVVYSVSIVMVRSRDGGKTWMSIRGAPGGDDYQNLWINPNDPNIILVVSDQGAIVTVNGGETWSSWYNQPTAQLYHVGVTNTFPYRVCAGQQESGSVCILSRGNDGEITFRDWHPVATIEYGYVAPDPLDPDIIYGGGRSEVSKYHWSTGQAQNVTPIPVRNAKYRTDRTEPTLFSPIDPHILYFASNILFKTTDGGETWQTISPDLTRESPGVPSSVGALASKNPDAGKQRGAIYALAPSFKDVNTLWAGTDDGLIWTTRDGGKNWNNITPPELTAWSKVTQIEASHFDDQSAYASVSRFRIDDLHPYVYRTHDGGKTWKLITEGLPADAPVDAVREDPVRKGLLFAGTETSVWVSFDDGDHWQSLQLNLPHTSMRDLGIHENDLILATHGRSFWILDDIAPLRQLADSMVNSDAYLFKPEVAYRVRRSTNPDTPIPPDEPTGKNPPDGAILDYFLAQPASSPVTLEVADAQGKVVRRFSSVDKPEVTQAELEKQLIPLYWIRVPKILSASAGMHRWLWDLHYPSPASLQQGYPISAVPYDTPRTPQGPLALPGEYTARLTANGHTFTAPLTVKIDPRVNTSPSALEQQFNLEMRLASELTASTEAVAEARSLVDQLRKLGAQSGKLTDAIKALDQKVGTVLGARMQPATGASEPALTRENAAIGMLYGSVGQADAAPTAAQETAAADTERDLATVLKRWEEIKQSDLPALNRQLKSTKLPEIHLESKAPADDGGADLE
ncbi:MAG: glycoside hydrolase [Terriglobales bacterium]